MSFHEPAIILNFHGIGEPPVPIPDDEAPYWIGEDAFRRILDSAIRATEHEPVTLVVSFDDGNASDLASGAPILREFGLRGLFFPCAGRLGKPGYLDRAALLELCALGFEIGSHGMDHLPWATLDAARLETEAGGSKARLEDALGRSVTSLALPFGSYNRRALAAARNAGYERVYSSDPAIARPGQWLRPRFSFRTGRSFDYRRMLADDADPLRRRLRALKTLAKSLR